MPTSVTTNANSHDLLSLVELLQEIDENQTNAKLNQYSMFNHYLGKSKGDDSEMRTWFYYYNTLKKNGIIGSNNETVERQAR